MLRGKVVEMTRVILATLTGSGDSLIVVTTFAKLGNPLNHARVAKCLTEANVPGTLTETTLRRHFWTKGGMRRGRNATDWRRDPWASESLLRHLFP